MTRVCIIGGSVAGCLSALSFSELGFEVRVLERSAATLTDRGARFVTEGDDDFDQRCAEHYPLPEGVTAPMWRDNQRLLVEGAGRVIFPSADCQRRFTRFFRVQPP